MRSSLTRFAGLFCAGANPLNAADTGSTLSCQPSVLADGSQRFSAWCHSMVVRDGWMFNAVSVPRFGSDGTPNLRKLASEGPRFQYGFVNNTILLPVTP